MDTRIANLVGYFNFDSYIIKKGLVMKKLLVLIALLSTVGIAQAAPGYTMWTERVIIWGDETFDSSVHAHGLEAWGQAWIMGSEFFMQTGLCFSWGGFEYQERFAIIEVAQDNSYIAVRDNANHVHYVTMLNNNPLSIVIPIHPSLGSGSMLFKFSPAQSGNYDINWMRSWSRNTNNMSVNALLMINNSF